MRMLTAARVFKMLVHSIIFPRFVRPVSSAVFRNSENFSCAKDVNASRFEAKCLIGQNSFGRENHSFADFPGMGLGRLDQLYQFEITAVKTGNGLAQQFFLYCFCVNKMPDTPAIFT